MRRGRCGGIALAALLVVAACQAGPPEEPKPSVKENHMAVYSRLYADFQQRSFLPVTSNATGRERWFVPLAESGFSNPPTVLLATPIGLVVQSVDRLALISSDGVVAWSRSHGSGMSAVYADSAVYYRGKEGDLYAVDAMGKPVVSDFFVPTATDRGFIFVAMPVTRDRILLHTFNRAEEPEPGDPPQPSNFQLLLMGAEKYDDWDWIHEFEGGCLPALLTVEHDRVVLLSTIGSVTVYDVKTGEKRGAFELAGTELLQASVDNENRLVAALVTADGEPAVACYDLNGKRIWQLPVEMAERHVFHQPPAIGNDNRVYYINADDLLVIDSGTIAWQTKVARSDRRYVTVLADGSAVVTSASIAVRFDKDGNAACTITLDPAEPVVAPAVASENGDLYLATVHGIHCYQ